MKKLLHVTQWPLPSNGRINSLTVSVLALQVSGFLAFVFTRVWYHAKNVLGIGVTQLDAKLVRFVWHVLNEFASTFHRKQLLVDCQIPLRLVACLAIHDELVPNVSSRPKHIALKQLSSNLNHFLMSLNRSLVMRSLINGQPYTLDKQSSHGVFGQKTPLANNTATNRRSSVSVNS